MITLTVNGSTHELDVDPTTPLLWVLRDHLGLTGTKFGCGVAQCGSCTVHLNGRAMRTCVLPVSAAANGEVVTIEGLGTPESPHPVQQAWADLNVAQCGYCQSGQIMAASALLADNPNPSDEDIHIAMTNLCRCGTYQKIVEGIRKAVALS